MKSTTKKQKGSSMWARIDEWTAVLAIRQGLIRVIPVLMIGSFALILNSLPVVPYQTFIDTFANGFLTKMFVAVHQATFGIMSLFITASISISYSALQRRKGVNTYGCAISALACYIIFIGFFNEGFNTGFLGAQGMFSAIASGLLASALFCAISSQEVFRRRFYTVGADVHYNEAVSAIIPCGLVVTIAFLVNFFITRFLHVQGFEAMMQQTMNGLFNMIQNHSIKAIMFILVTSLLWFFGLHGSNVLEGVALNIFVDGAAINQQFAGAIGGTQIFTKTFYNVFVMMGGCGATLSLVFAMLLFSKHKNNRNLAGVSLFPMLFNINELVVYGLPIVFNLWFFISFMLTPLASTLTSWVAIRTGLVPPPINWVEWVTPVGLGGYISTGSIRGAVLQLVNLVLGIVIYRWFFVRYEKRETQRAQADLSSLVDMLKNADKAGEPLRLSELGGREGNIVKMLTADLKNSLPRGKGLSMHYQPQVDSDYNIIGMEALLRWNHPRGGMIYPPLLIGIANENGLLQALEYHVLGMVLTDFATMEAAGVPPAKISVNITASTLQEPDFGDKLKVLLEKTPGIHDRLHIELTEQMSFLMQDDVEEQMQRIRDMGVRFEIDDFMMGHTSLKYLQSNQFDVVKLDGALVWDMMVNPRSQEIIASILHMSHTMHFDVLAEFVETPLQRAMLKKLGCTLYQGYLFSPPVPLRKALKLLRDRRLVPEIEENRTELVS